MITIFTPSFADEADTNAQNLSVKEIVARLDPTRIAVTMLHEGAIDPRIRSRPNTRFLRWHRHGNTMRGVLNILSDVPDLYFFPREGPLDAVFLRLRRHLWLKTALISYVVSGGLDAGPYMQARIDHIRQADSVFANNDYLAQLLREKMGIISSGTIYDGVDRRYYFPPRTPRAARHEVTVLCAGSLRPEETRALGGPAGRAISRGAVSRRGERRGGGTLQKSCGAARLPECRVSRASLPTRGRRGNASC